MTIRLFRMQQEFRKHPLNRYQHRWTGGDICECHRSLCVKGDSANAVPHYQKLRVRVTNIWGNRRGQPNLSAMERPHPRGTAFMITVNLHAR